MITAIVIPVELDQPIRQQQLNQHDLDAYRQLVGGHLELVHFVRPPAGMYINDEGKLDGLPLNHRATALLWAHNSAFRNRDVIVGPAFVVGPADRRGDDTSAPTDLVELLFSTERYRAQVQTGDSSNWYGNELVFTDWLAAYQYVLDLADRWTLVQEVRIIPKPDDAMLDQWYEIGRGNLWIRHADDPPFTMASFSGCQSIDELEERLGYTNWSLGTAFYYRNLCFINQVDGGDEWLAIKTFWDDGRPNSLAFESITFARYIEEGRLKDLIERLLKASKEDCRRLTY
ncbi:DUF3846 domain-containing protein [Actinophytocola algeriensis]|uniref:DUF3846 domain-containing protein n=1 Tax=Actinophytocola algeriensis TaxID=1768010 RepID=A0A7W7QBK3_9PSEU|nr:DUF3846 domain-containing protein [Actinophytocola algeriensis]MBB4910537.1 hypothetical protein [Actinophytocola algeriensis]MBE1480474.1 hypothetical protein [Actinophytocola algeriensis]